MDTLPEFTTHDIDLASAVITNDTLEFTAIRSVSGNAKEKIFVFRDRDSIGSHLLSDFVSGKIHGNFAKFCTTKNTLLSLIRRMGVGDELTFRR
jgi:hypothetical protein